MQPEPTLITIKLPPSTDAKQEARIKQAVSEIWPYSNVEIKDGPILSVVATYPKGYEKSVADTEHITMARIREVMAEK